MKFTTLRRVGAFAAVLVTFLLLVKYYCLPVHSTSDPSTSTASSMLFTLARGVLGSDPDAWLDRVGEKGHFPAILKSQHADVFGVEPFEMPDLPPFKLHVIPTEAWYETATKATNRCELELTRDPSRWPGAVKVPNRRESVGAPLTDADYGLEDKVVWVTAFFDFGLDRERFSRQMFELYRRFQSTLDRGYQMVLYMQPEMEQKLEIDRSRIHVIHMTVADMQEYFPYHDRVQAIRTSKLWQEQAVLTGWLDSAPQARLPGYNPIVMSKLLLLRDAAKLNPWGARYHMWMDAGHYCAPSQHAGETSLYRAPACDPPSRRRIHTQVFCCPFTAGEHMSKGMFVTHWPYATTTEVHGFADKAMHMYMAQAEDPLQIVRGGIFGGMYPYISCVLRAYMIVLHTTLRDGYMGTEECIWTIVHRRFPHLFSSFDNNSLGGYRDDCASFMANADREREIKAGKQLKFVSPPVPDRLTWWAAALQQAGTGIHLRSAATQR